MGIKGNSSVGSLLPCWVFFSCTHYWGSTVIHIKTTKLGHLWKVGVSGNFQRGSKGCLIWWEIMRWKDFPFQFTNVNCPKVLDAAMKLLPTLDPYLLTNYMPEFDHLVIGAITDLHLPPSCHELNFEMQSNWPREYVFLPKLQGFMLLIKGTVALKSEPLVPLQWRTYWDSFPHPLIEKYTRRWETHQRNMMTTHQRNKCVR